MQETVVPEGCVFAICRFPFRPQVMHYSPPGEEICPFVPSLKKRIVTPWKNLPSFRIDRRRAFPLTMACSLLYGGQQRGSEKGLTKKVTRRNFR